MTVASQTASITLLGDGSTTIFNYDFEIPFQPGGTVPAVSVYKTVGGKVTDLVLTADFTITGVGVPAGGTVTYPLSGAPLTSADSITIFRSLEYTQESTFSAQSLYPPDIEVGLDQLEFQIQQLETGLLGAVRERSGGTLPFLPGPATRSNTIYGFDASGMPELYSIGTPTTSFNVVLFDSVAALRAGASAPPGGEIAFLRGYYSPGDGGGGYFAYVNSDTTSADNGGMIVVSGAARWYRVEAANDVQAIWFGVLANADQTTAAVTPYATDIQSSPVTISLQTVDGAAYNNAINWLRSVGGGTLRVPSGLSYIYGYLQRVDFSLTVIGQGPDVSVFKNCNTSPPTTGYGIFVVTPTTYAQVTFDGIGLDGNATIRVPAGEVRAYPVVFYGLVKGILRNVRSINSPIDCLLVNHTNNDIRCGFFAENCLFDTAFRNTVSVVSGWYVRFSKCIMRGGGGITTGTAPSLSLDVEQEAGVMRYHTYEDCVFGLAKTGGITETTGVSATFIRCVWDGTSAPASCPLNITVDSQVNYLRCSFLGNPATRSQHSLLRADTITGNFGMDQFDEYEDCSWEGAGMFSLHPVRFKDCSGKNSWYPFIFEESGGLPTLSPQLTIRGLILTNVIDKVNASGGAFAGFVVLGNLTNFVRIDGLDLIWDTTLLPTGAVPADWALVNQYGIYLNPASIGAAVSWLVKNVNVIGWYQKYPTFIAATLSTANFRDWGTPNVVPPDTGGNAAPPGAVYYAGNTQYGNNA